MNCPVNNDEPEYDLQHLPERQRLLKKLVADIKSCKPPMVFGVHGDWGAGKTSFLQAVMYELTGDCPAKAGKEPAKKEVANAEWKKAPLAVWFEAWRYQNESAPIIALLHQLRTQLSTWHKASEVAKNVGHNAWRNFMLAFDSIVLKVESEAGIPGIKAGVGMEVAPFQMAKAREEVQKARFTTPLPSNQIREAMDGILEKLLPKRARVVIFIDDLDRCSAMSMFSLLESIKIYLNLRHCVFVLGINRHELERGIASILPEPIVEREQREVRAHEYIEKLCGNIIRLPYPTPNAQAALVERWLGGLDDHSRESLVKLVKNHRFLPMNPRRVKMWCNTISQLWRHYYDMNQAAPAETELPALALVAALHTFYPTLHQALASAPSFMDALKKWCVAEQRFEQELDVFAGLMRVFVEQRFLTKRSSEELALIDSLDEIELAALLIKKSALSNDAVLLNQIKKQSQKDQLAALRQARISELSPVLKRAYGWSGGLDANTDSEKSPESTSARIPLLTDPSSLHYFHPQYLVADEIITEAQVRPYLHLD